MLKSAKEFLKLRVSEDPEEYRRAAHEPAPLAVWYEVINAYPEMKVWVVRNKTVPLEILTVLSLDHIEQVRCAVARKRKLDKGLFMQLAKDASDRVRCCLA